MTREDRLELDRLRALEAEEQTGIAIIDDVELEEVDAIELDELPGKIIYEHDYNFKIKKNGKALIVKAEVVLTDIDVFTMKDCESEFNKMANAGELTTDALDGFFEDCIILTEYDSGEAYHARTKEKLMIFSFIMKELTPSAAPKPNRQERRMAERKSKRRK